MLGAKDICSPTKPLTHGPTDTPSDADPILTPGPPIPSPELHARRSLPEPLATPATPARREGTTRSGQSPTSGPVQLRTPLEGGRPSSPWQSRCRVQGHKGQREAGAWTAKLGRSGRGLAAGGSSYSPIVGRGPGGGGAGSSSEPAGLSGTSASPSRVPGTRP